MEVELQVKTLFYESTLRWKIILVTLETKRSNHSKQVRIRSQPETAERKLDLSDTGHLEVTLASRPDPYVKNVSDLMIRSKNISWSPTWINNLVRSPCVPFSE